VPDGNAAVLCEGRHCVRCTVKKKRAKTDQRIILVGVLMDVDPIACRLMLEIGQA
jgi:hypothetical protein